MLALREMANAWRTVIEQLRQASSAVEHASGDILNAAGQTSSRLDQQQEALEMVVSAVDQMAATVQEIAANASQSADSSEAARGALQHYAGDPATHDWPPGPTSRWSARSRPGRTDTRWQQPADRLGTRGHSCDCRADQPACPECRNRSRTGRRTGAAASPWSPTRSAAWPCAHAPPPRKSYRSSAPLADSSNQALASMHGSTEQARALEDENPGRARLPRPPR